MKLDDLVNNHLRELSQTDLIVWRYISNHRKECCYVSIYDLADACNVSRTTVLRFAKKLGLDGFSDLKMILKMENSKPVKSLPWILQMQLPKCAMSWERK